MISLRWTLAAAAGALAIGASGLGLSRALVAQEPEKPVVPAPEVRPAELRSPIHESTAIVELAPSGKPVEKGETVCRLDDSSLKDQLATARIGELKVAEGHARVAKARLEAALMAREEYASGTFAVEAKELMGRIALLDKRAGAGEVVGDPAEAALEREVLESKLDALNKYTKPRKLKELEAGIAEAQLEAEQASDHLAGIRDKVERLAREVEECTIVAPAAGVFMTQVREGDIVRRHQIIGKIVAEKALSR